MKKALSTALALVILLSGNIQPVKAESILNSQGQKAEVYTSADANNRNGVKTTVSVSFIEDPHNSNLTALVSLKGFIPSQLIKTGTYNSGFMYWPSKYSVTVKSVGDDKVKVLDSIPKNKIETVKVTQSMGYSIGGNVSVKSDLSGSGGGNVGFNVQRSISYEQPDFKTIQRSDDIDAASWDILFNKTKDGYDRDSYHGIYGNQMFMKSRLSNTGMKNLTDETDLSPLITGGFSPDMVIALTAPKGTEKSQLEVEYIMNRDHYTLDWYSSGWWGVNNKNVGQNPSIQKYELDWENHTVTFIGE